MTTIARVALLGPMGIGKTTAIRAVCGNLAVDCDVPNLDITRHSKATTTVGADFGEVDLGDGDKMQLYGCPGQDRFDFVRQWVLSSAVGAFVLADLNESEAADEMALLLDEIAISPCSPLPVVLIARPAAGEQINRFTRALEQRGKGLVPVLQADVRDRQQMLDMLQVLVSMLSLKEASA